MKNKNTVIDAKIGNLNELTKVLWGSRNLVGDLFLY